MKSKQEETTLKHEIIAGASYGNTFGGRYYMNLDHYQNPLIKYIAETDKDSYSIVDLGGGSGIVGCSLLKKLLDLGKKGTLDVIDINQRQLEGVNVEARRLGIPLGLVRTFQKDIITMRTKQYDVTCMRKVLHYFDEQNNIRFIQRLPHFLRPGGLLIIGSMVGIDSLDSRYKEDILNEIEWFIAKGSNFSSRSILTENKLRELLSIVGFVNIQETQYSEGISSKQLQDKFGLCDELMEKLDNKERERLKNTKEKNPYDWKTKVYSCRK